jgi:hypothetical protein
LIEMTSPTPSSRNSTIRLFVSSTFKDLKAERDALQRDVFPRLKQLCLSRGLRFQAIDLRWGISQEAGRDNKTMRICLRELRRCQQDRPKPNFLVLLGDRYGWRPLPEIIPASLFERLAAQLRSTNPSAAQLLQKAYRLDENAVHVHDKRPVHELQPRGDIEGWHDTVGTPLRAALETAVAAMPAEPGLAELAIGLGATHQEILEGALKVEAKDAREHVHAFFREIKNLSNAPLPAAFVDPDAVAHSQELLGQLKHQLGEHLGKDNVHPFTMEWQKSGADDEGSFTEASLKKFCDEVFQALSVVIEDQIARLTSVTVEKQEEQAHQDFGRERCHRFVGRVEPLRRIADYLRDGTGKPLAVIGPSGSGKSAVMAKVVEEGSQFEVQGLKLASASLPPRPATQEWGEGRGEGGPRIFTIARYIGATPGSSDLIQLLRNLVVKIRQRYAVAADVSSRETSQSGEGEKTKPNDSEIPFEYNPLVNAFHEALQRPTADKPLFLFLDALDQLTASHQAHSLAWLPGSLNPHVRLVVSAALPTIEPVAADVSPLHSSGEEIRADSHRLLPRAANDPRVTIMAALTSRLDAGQRVTLTPLTTDDGEEMLTNWLADAHRTLQPAQRQAILETFKVEGSPLWLRVATEEAARLASWQPAPAFAPSTPGLLGQVLDHLSRKEEHGDKLVSRTLSYLACARHGLAEDEILDILSADKEVMDDFVRRSPNSPKVNSLPVAVWVRLHGDLAFYLAEHQAQGVNLLGFYHRSFLEAIRSSYLGAMEKRFAAHKHLAVFFTSRWQSPDTHALLELVTQQIRGELWNELEATLTNVGFLQAKAAPELWIDLLADLKMASEVGPHPSGRKDILSWLGPRLSAYCKHPDHIRSEIANEFLPTIKRPELIRRFEAQLSEQPSPILRSEPKGGNPVYLRYPHGGAKNGIEFLIVARDIPIAISAESWGVIAAWELSTGRLLRFWDLESAIFGVIVSADGERIAVRGSSGIDLIRFDGSVQHAERLPWMEEDSLRPKDGEESCTPITATPDSNTVVTVWGDSHILAWDWKSGSILAVFELPSGDRIRDYAVTRTHILIATAAGRALRFEIGPRVVCEEIFSIPGGSISGVASNSDGQTTAWAVTSPSIAARLDNPFHANNPWFLPHEVVVVSNGSTVTIDEVSGPKKLWIDESGDFLISSQHDFADVYCVSLALEKGMGGMGYGSRSKGRVFWFKGEWAAAPDASMILVCESEQPSLVALSRPFQDNTALRFPPKETNRRPAFLLAAGNGASHAAWRERNRELLHFWTLGSDVGLECRVAAEFSPYRQISRDGRVVLTAFVKNDRKQRLRIDVRGHSTAEEWSEFGEDHFCHERISSEGRFVMAERPRDREWTIQVFEMPSVLDGQLALVGQIPRMRYLSSKFYYPETVCIAETRGELWVCWHEKAPNFRRGLARWNITNLGNPPDLIELTESESRGFKLGFSRGGRVVFASTCRSKITLLALRADNIERRMIYEIPIRDDGAPSDNLHWDELDLDIDSTGNYSVVAYRSFGNRNESFLCVIDLRGGGLCRTDAAAWPPSGRVAVTNDGVYVASICDNTVAIWKTDFTNGSIALYSGFWIDQPADVTFVSPRSVMVLTAFGETFRYEIREG